MPEYQTQEEELRQTLVRMRIVGGVAVAVFFAVVVIVALLAKQ